MNRITRFLALTLAGAVVISGCTDKRDGNKVIGNMSPELSQGQGQASEEALYGMLNLDYPGLEAVKAAVQNEDWYNANIALLQYYRDRSDLINPKVNLISPSLSVSEQSIADEALEYRFFVKNFYQDYDGSQYTCYDFSDGNGGINWELTVEGITDQEFRYQRHRHQWMEKQARAYWMTRDEKYAESIITVLRSWHDTYPCPVGTVFPPEGTENDVDYQWKGLQVSERVMNTLAIVDYCKNSEAFADGGLLFILEKLAQSVEVIRLNYYQSSNILISQAQAVGAAGILFPEFKNAQAWAREGYGKLGEQLQAQFLEDGVQYELDPSYHIAAIADFREAYELANLNGRAQELGADTFYDKLYGAAKFVQDITYPDYSIDNFNDTRASSYSKSVLKRNFGNYATMFPEDTEFNWMATEGKSGTQPSHKMALYKTSGYYVLRSGWNTSANVLIHKNNYNPENKWHCQPDNGTFSLWRKGRNFFPDAGVYSYGGSTSTNASRNAYRKSSNHNTVTIAGANFDANHQKGTFVRSEEGSAYNMISTSNSPKDGFNHTRTFFSFDSGDVIVIVDEISGEGGGTVDINMHMTTDSAAPTVFEDLGAEGAAGLYTTFTDGNNMLVRSYVPEGADGFSAGAVDSDVSNNIGVVSGQRKGYKMSASKAAGSPLRFVSVIYGCKNATSIQSSAIISGRTVRVSVADKVYTANF